MATSNSSALVENVTNSTSSPVGYPLPGLLTIVASITFSVVGSIGLILYFLILIAIARNREKFRFPYYTFLFTLGIGEMLDLFCQGPFNAFCLLRAYALDSATCEIPQWIDRTIGWIQMLDFIAEYPLDLLIAFERLVAVVFFTHRANIFTPRRVAAMCVVGWLYALISASPLMVWYMPVSFIAGELTQDFESWGPDEFTWNQTTGAMGGTLIIISVIFYVITISSLVARQIRNKKVLHSGAASAAPNMKPEVKLMIQSMLRFSLIVTVILFANTQNGFTSWTFYAFAMLVLAVPLNTTIVTICLNSDIREEICRMLCRKPTVAMHGAAAMAVAGTGNHYPLSNVVFGTSNVQTF